MCIFFYSSLCLYRQKFINLIISSLFLFFFTFNDFSFFYLLSVKFSKPFFLIKCQRTFVFLFLKLSLSLRFFFHFHQQKIKSDIWLLQINNLNSLLDMSRMSMKISIKFNEKASRIQVTTGRILLEQLFAVVGELLLNCDWRFFKNNKYREHQSIYFFGDLCMNLLQLRYPITQNEINISLSRLNVSS